MGAGSAQSSRDVMGLVLVVSASQLLVVIGFRFVLGESSGAEGVSVGDTGVVVGLAAVVVVSEVVGASR